MGSDRSERRGQMLTDRCPACGKTQFTTRKAARRTGRALYPEKSCSAYRCESGGQWWHYGTLAPVIRRWSSCFSR